MTEPTRVELVWPGKAAAIDRVPLPFQIAETINRSRASREGLLSTGNSALDAATEVLTAGARSTNMPEGYDLRRG